MPQAEANALARSHADAVVDLAPAQLVEDAGDQVALAGPRAAAGEDHVVRLEHAEERCTQDGRVVPDHRFGRRQPVMGAPGGHGGHVAGKDLA